MSVKLEALTSLESHAKEILKGVEFMRELELNTPIITISPSPPPITVTTPSPAPSPPPVQSPPTQAGKRAIPWGKQCKALDPDFIASVLWIEEQLELKAENLIACMKFESNLNPKARNPRSTASGLIQFMSGTAKNLGTTIEHIRSLGAIEQLSYVYKYFKAFGSDLSSWDIADTYMAILWPAGINKPDDYKVFVNDPKRSNDAYDVNKGLDVNKDGFVSKKEAASKVIKLYHEGFDSANVLYI